MSPKELYEKALEYAPDTNIVSLYNGGARAVGKLIHRGEDGWHLIDPAKVPLLFKGHIWGPPDVFQKQEVAAFRREVIRHLLVNSPGLMEMQVVELLRQYSNYKVKANKDLVKGDMEAMQEAGEIKRIGNSRKWTIQKEPKP
jgi:hypothetical protein